MDFHKPRYTPMSRRRRIYEGKAKVLYEGPEPGTLIQHFKDDATAFNAKKHEVIEGKGVLNNRISEYVFQHLNDIGVPTHFIRRLNMREQLIREVEIIPLEVVVRNVAAGSLSQRLGIEEGTQLPRSIIEFYYKNDQLNDPMVSEEHITAFGWATPQEIDDIMALAIRVNDFLSGVFLGVGIRLVDFKMETGRLWENDLMRIVVADEISPDSCRLWDIKSNEKLDKDRFRKRPRRPARGLYRSRQAPRHHERRRASAGHRPGAGEGLTFKDHFVACRCVMAGLVPAICVSRLIFVQLMPAARAGAIGESDVSRTHRIAAVAGIWLVLGGAVAAQDYPDAAGPFRRPLRRRRRHRRDGAVFLEGTGAALRPALRGGEPPGIGHHHRRELRRQVGARRTHHPARHLIDLCDRGQPLQEAALQSGHGLRADRAGRGRALRADRASRRCRSIRSPTWSAT